VLVIGLVARLYRGPGKAQEPAVAMMLSFTVAFAALLFVVRDIPLLFFRNYFYLELIRVPCLALLLYAAILRMRNARLLAAVALFLLGGTLCWMRTAHSGWDYSDSGSLSMPFSLSNVMQRWGHIEGH